MSGTHAKTRLVVEKCAVIWERIPEALRTSQEVKSPEYQHASMRAGRPHGRFLVGILPAEREVTVSITPAPETEARSMSLPSDVMM